MVLTKLNKNIIVILSVALVPVLSLYFNYNPAESELFPKCLFYHLTGHFCPGCGTQRAAYKILHGDIFGGLNHNFLIILLPIILTYDVVIYTIKKHSGKLVKNVLHHPKTIYGILVLVLLFWVLRNVNFYPFTILAP